MSKSEGQLLVRRRFLETYGLSLMMLLCVLGGTMKAYYLEDPSYWIGAILTVPILIFCLFFAPRRKMLIDDEGIKIFIALNARRYGLIKWNDIEEWDGFNLKIRNGPSFSIRDLKGINDADFARIKKEITQRLKQSGA